MKASDLSDGDYTITVSESAMLDDRLTVVRWFPAYWEIRNSAMGYSIMEAIRVNAVAPWQTYAEGSGPLDEVTEWVMVDEELVRQHDVPEIIINRMKERKLL